MKQKTEWRRKCADMLEDCCKGYEDPERRRYMLYIRLAGEMRIEVRNCCFCRFDLKQLKEAHWIMEQWKKNPPEDLDYSAATEPCLSCYLAEWEEMYGVMVYACDMHYCVKAAEDEVWL